jgi:IS5 family transposase
MRRFAGIELISNRIPDEPTILAFRHLPEKHRLGEQIFETVKVHLSPRGMTMRQGTIVAATLIAAPSSTLTEQSPSVPEALEQGRQSGSGDAPDQEGEPVVLLLLKDGLMI